MVIHDDVRNYPVVRRELRSYGYSYSLLNGELRSYQKFPNNTLDDTNFNLNNNEKSDPASNREILVS